MIIVDMNQVTISNLMMQIGSKHQNDVDEDLVRHMVLNSLRMYRSRFGKEYGELILFTIIFQTTKLIVKRIEQSQDLIGMQSLKH